MKPIDLEIKHQKYIITHRCIKCGEEKKCKMSKNDNFDAIIKLTEIHTASRSPFSRG